MAFRVEQASVTAGSATLVFTAQPGDVEILVRPASGLLLGGDSSVTASTGFSHTTGSPLQVRVRPGDELWAYDASAVNVTILVRSA